jgi:hypothetical protein
MKNKTRYTFYNDGATTVCLIKVDGDVVARGLSICSRADSYDPLEGEDKARSRALEALNRQADCGEIRLDLPRASWMDVLNVSLARERYGNYKGYYKPALTQTENMLFGKREILDTRKLSGEIEQGTVKDETRNTKSSC